MITAKQLSRKRMLSEWKFQYKVWKMAVDWTVALYLVIPALIVAGYQYYLLWTEPPSWFAYLSLPAVAIILYLLSGSGTVRYYLEEGDQLFIWQRKLWLDALMRHSMIRSILFICLKTAVLMLVFAPLLMKGLHYPAAWAAAYGVFVFLFRLCSAFVLQAIQIHYSGWRWFVVRWLFFAVAGFIFVAASRGIADAGIWAAVPLCAAGLIALPFLIRLRLGMRGALLTDIQREQRQKMKYVALLLRGFVQKQSKPRRRSPVLFAKSGSLFRHRSQENLLTEQTLKALFRNPSRLTLYTQLTAVGCGGELVLHPVSVIPQWILWGMSLLLFVFMTRKLARDAADHPFLRLFPWKEEAVRGSMKKTMFCCSALGFIPVTLCFGLTAFPWWKGLLLIPFGLAIIYMSALLLAEWADLKRQA